MSELLLRKVLRLAVSALLAGLLVLALFLLGCSNGSPTVPTDDTTQTNVTATSSTLPSRPDSSTVSTSTTSPATGPTTTQPELMSDLDKELAKTVRIQHSYATYLSSQKVGDDDPRMALFFGLRARTQALSCLASIEKGNLDIADTAMLEVYRSLNQGQAVAIETTAQILSQARAIVAELGKPSEDPEKATPLLEQFVESLTPLLDEATSVLSTTTTTLSAPPSTTGP